MEIPSLSDFQEPKHTSGQGVGLSLYAEPSQGRNETSPAGRGETLYRREYLLRAAYRGNRRPMAEHMVGLDPRSHREAGTV